MACGKAVVLSDTAGLWDRGLMRHGENCILVEPGDPGSLERAIAGLLAEPDRARALGRAARNTIETSLDVATMSEAMRRILLEHAPVRRTVHDAPP